MVRAARRFRPSSSGSTSVISAARLSGVKVAGAKVIGQVAKCVATMSELCRVGAQRASEQPVLPSRSVSVCLPLRRCRHQLGVRNHQVQLRHSEFARLAYLAAPERRPSHQISCADLFPGWCRCEAITLRTRPLMMSGPMPVSTNAYHWLSMSGREHQSPVQVNRVMEYQSHKSAHHDGHAVERSRRLVMSSILFSFFIPLAHRCGYSQE